MRLRDKTAAATAMLICLMLNITACGGGNNVSTDNSTAVKTGAEIETEAAAEVSPTRQEVIELKFHHHDPVTSLSGKFFEDWAKEVSDASEGTLKITVYAGAELGAAKDTYDMVVNGEADIAWGIPAYFPGRFPLSEVFNLPMMEIGDAVKASQIFWNLYTQTDYLKSEYEPIKVLFLHCHTDVPIAMKSSGLKSMLDLKGKRIRVAGKSETEFFEALGALPISIPATDIYSSLEKGVLDGVAADWHLQKSFNLPEQTKYYLDARLYEGPLFCIMNQRVYDSLPPQAKKAIDAKSGQYAVSLASKAWQSARQETLDIIKANNGTVTELTPEMKAEFQKAAETVWSNWIKANEEKGLPAQEVFDYVKAAAKN